MEEWIYRSKAEIHQEVLVMMLEQSLSKNRIEITTYFGNQNTLCKWLEMMNGWNSDLIYSFVSTGKKEYHPHSVGGIEKGPT